MHRGSQVAIEPESSVLDYHASSKGYWNGKDLGMNEQPVDWWI
jgi:hypothetical protein